MTDLGPGLHPGGPRVVALGGGHGLATALRAARRYAGSLAAVASVADDGGSSGRLRRDLDVPAPGDLRKCLEALAGSPTPLAAAFDHRFSAGELEGHALGNLLIVGLAEALGDLRRGLDECGRLLGAVGRVLPATVDPVVLKARLDQGGDVEGQVAVQEAAGRIRRVEIIPADAEPCAEAIDELRLADQILIAPGSLYTSVVAVLCVGEVREALTDSSATVVQIANLGPQVPETAGLDATDHLRAVVEHGARVDCFLHGSDGTLPMDPDEIRRLGAEPRSLPLARSGSGTHDPAKLAEALRDLL